MRVAVAPDAIAEVAEDGGADRARHESDELSAEGGDDAVEGVLPAREEQLREDESRRRSVEEEVVPLDRGADNAREGRSPGCLFPGYCLNTHHSSIGLMLLGPVV
jgi:hypothetical protein